MTQPQTIDRFVKERGFRSYTVVDSNGVPAKGTAVIDEIRRDHGDMLIVIASGQRLQVDRTN